MLDLNKPVQTRDGRKARIVCTDKKGRYRIIACIEHPNLSGVEDCYTYTLEGICNESRGKIDIDLINAPEKYVMYINISTSEIGDSYIGGAYKTRRSADSSDSELRTECIRVEFEEGQFDK